MATFFQMLPEFAHNRPKKRSNAPRFLPKPCPNLFQILPRPSQSRPKRPFGAHLGAMLEKSCILNIQNTNKSRPRAAQRGPRPSQPPPKWGPRPSQIRFLGEFLACFFQLYNFFDFCSNFSWISHVFVRADLQNSCAHAVFCWLFSKIVILEKSAKNHRKIIPKPFQNPSKIHPKSMKNRKKSMNKAMIT